MTELQQLHRVAVVVLVVERGKDGDTLAAFLRVLNGMPHLCHTGGVSSPVARRQAPSMLGIPTGQTNYGDQRTEEKHGEDAGN